MACVDRRSIVQTFGQQQVPGQRLEHVLPGTHCRRIAYPQLCAARERTHAVGQQTVVRPVAAAHDIAGARSAYRDTVRTKIRIAEGRSDNFRAGLAGTVRIAAAKRVVLAIRPFPLAVLVALVGSDHHYCFQIGGRAQGLQ